MREPSCLEGALFPLPLNAPHRLGLLVLAVVVFGVRGVG